MLIKPQFESYRYTDEICTLKSQSMVECRLPGSEIGSILTIQAKAMPTESACADGEVRYNGKLLLCVVYEDGDNKICRAERGAEFFHKAEGASVTPACFAKTALTVENVSYRREGSGLYISVVVGAEARVYGGKQAEYLLGGDNLVTKQNTISLCKSICVSGETESEDEFETDFLGDILMHDETAVVTSVRVIAGQIEIAGEMGLNVCVLNADNSLSSYERLIPFSMQIPCEEAFGKVSASARVMIKNANLAAGVDEEKGRTRIVLSYCLAADCFLSALDELTIVQDAFSPLAKTTLKKAKGGGRYLTSLIKCTERVGGVAAMSVDFGNEYALAAATNPRAEIVCKKGERGMEAEGVVMAEVLLRGVDGGHKSCTLSLPFVFPLDTTEEIVEADCMVCGLNLRRKKEEKTEAEATLKISLRTYKNCEWEYVDGLEEGEAFEENSAAISVFIPRAGEDLWQVAKRLSRAPEELKKSNPDLEFPVREGERIFVYRQIK